LSPLHPALHTLNIDRPAKRVFKRLLRDIRAALLEKAQGLKDKANVDYLISVDDVAGFSICQQFLETFNLGV
jgi:hypothetical protein